MHVLSRTNHEVIGQLDRKIEDWIHQKISEEAVSGDNEILTLHRPDNCDQIQPCQVLPASFRAISSLFVTFSIIQHGRLVFETKPVPDADFGCHYKEPEHQ